MKRRIAVIGGGQLGSRHLQALAKLEEPTHIAVVDPSPSSLEVCRGRVREVAGWDRHSYEFLQELTGLEPLDLAIVATSANVRRPVVEKLLSANMAPNLLLEKVLFQRAIDCTEVGELLRSKGVGAWVNAPRRMWPFYRGLKQVLQGDKPASFRQTGSGWDMACNAYHFLDLFAFLSGSGIERLSPEFLDRQARESKRTGFKELSGTLVGCLEGGGFFSISDFAGRGIPLSVTIETTARVIRVDEIKKTTTVLSGPALDDGLVPEPKYQSELTHRFARAVLAGEPVELTGYEEASAIHRSMLRCFADVFAPDDDKETTRCPIT